MDGFQVEPQLWKLWVLYVVQSFVSQDANPGQMVCDHVKAWATCTAQSQTQWPTILPQMKNICSQSPPGARNMPAPISSAFAHSLALSQGYTGMPAAARKSLTPS